jgi:hypothetical protein
LLNKLPNYSSKLHMVFLVKLFLCVPLEISKPACRVVGRIQVNEIPGLRMTPQYFNVGARFEPNANERLVGGSEDALLANRGVLPPPEWDVELTRFVHPI